MELRKLQIKIGNRSQHVSEISRARALPQLFAFEPLNQPMISDSSAHVLTAPKVLFPSSKLRFLRPQLPAFHFTSPMPVQHQRSNPQLKQKRRMLLHLFVYHHLVSFSCHADPEFPQHILCSGCCELQDAPCTDCRQFHIFLAQTIAKSHFSVLVPYDTGNLKKGAVIAISGGHVRSVIMNRRAHPVLFLTAAGIPRASSRLPPIRLCSLLLKSATPQLRGYHRHLKISKFRSREDDLSPYLGSDASDGHHRVSYVERRFFRSFCSHDNLRPRNSNNAQNKKSRADRGHQRSQSRLSNAPRNGTRWGRGGDGHRARMDVDRMYAASPPDVYPDTRTVLWPSASDDSHYASRKRVNGYSLSTTKSGGRSSGRPHGEFRKCERRDGDGGIRQQGWERRCTEPLTALQRAVASGDDHMYGLQSVHLALGAGRRDLHVLYLQPGGTKTGTRRKQGNTRLRAQIVERAQALGVCVSERDRGELNVLSGNRPHQGVVLQCGVLDFVPLSCLGEGDHGDVFLALDEVRDPQNVGALLRTAHFLGVKGVAVCKKNSSPITPVVSRASAGATEVMDVHGVESMPRFLRSTTGKGWRVLGAASEHGAVELWGRCCRDPQRCLCWVQREMDFEMWLDLVVQI